MTVIDTTAVKTTNILPVTTSISTTTAKTSADTEAQIINNDTRDIPVSRKFGVSGPPTPITTGTIKTEIMKEIYCSGSLLEAVQKANIFHDCKHFVDMPLKIDAESTLHDWHELIESGQIDENSLRHFVESHFDEPGGELDTCEPSDFDPEYGKFESINSPSYRQWAKELHRKWPTLCRKVSDRVIADPEKFSLIPLPKPFVVPGGRFREMYYWDSFFTIKGLLASGMHDTVRGMIENMGSLIERFGYVPNGNRVYYLNRSQPPLLTWCLSAYYEATGDKKFVFTGARWFEREFEFFQKHKSIQLPGVTSLLYRYHVVAVGPRPESYREDVESAHHIEDVLEKQRLWGDIAAAAESGRDFSSRWFSQDGPVAGKMGSTRTSSILPVDLNAIICGNLRLMANLYEVIDDISNAEQCREQFRSMKQAIHQVFWNEEYGCWFDYDIIHACHVNLYMDTNFFPLFSGCTHDDFDAQKIVTYMTNMGVLAFPGGLPSSLIASGQQWDFPNAWAPTTWVVIQGLRSTGQHELARQIAEKWIKRNYSMWLVSGGRMFEKYNVASQNYNTAGGGGEYEVQEGFGWTNGVVLDLLLTYGPDLTFKSDDDKPMTPGEGCVCCQEHQQISDGTTTTNTILVPSPADSGLQ
ncbi:trehalase I, putative [Brugia malayi]|uniref:Trehalase n=2 Tax=Brugia TaxID=6278 RepID=A0A0H5S2F9_BRUMA|nr:trehalase I, putative [Brugia malayi]CRZ22873.1 BMA-TRE-2 [Brugia malayi]VIO90138.1 trehalase I, putative [Brugia malayi]